MSTKNNKTLLSIAEISAFPDNIISIDCKWPPECNNLIFSDISQNPNTTEGDVIGLSLRNIDGNVAIKKISIFYKNQFFEDIKQYSENENNTSFKTLVESVKGRPVARHP